MKYIDKNGNERECVCPEDKINDEKTMCVHHFILKYPDYLDHLGEKINETFTTS